LPIPQKYDERVDGLERSSAVKIFNARQWHSIAPMASVQPHVILAVVDDRSKDIALFHFPIYCAYRSDQVMKITLPSMVASILAR
jgi:Ni/Fe-hydrogenase subunit HybB-like protein